ncbi:MAG: hypothetical protein ACE5EY_15495 [Anaerolineae bacterium]
MTSFATHSTLREPVLSELKQIGQADLIIGLPTYAVNPDTTAQVVRQAIIGAKKYYPNLDIVLINIDTGGQEDTRQAIQATAIPGIYLISGRHDGFLGRGAAVSAILHAALELQAKAIVLLDGCLQSITPTWIPGLATLVLNNQADLVKPRYNLSFFDSALSDLLFYPFTRAVWGVNLQQPAASDCALSACFARAVLAQDIWGTEVSRAGFDIWLSTFAAAENWRLAQTALGSKHYQVGPQPIHPLISFKESVGTMLYQLQVKRHIWPTLNQINPLPTLTEFAVKGDPFSTADYDPGGDIEALVLGWIEHRSLWQKVLLPENLSAVEDLARRPTDQFYFPSDLWAKVVYDFAVVYNKGELDPDAIVTSLYPLYLGRLAGFWPEVAGLTPIGRAGTVSAQGVEFEEHRSYLRDRWENYAL